MFVTAAMSKNGDTEAALDEVIAPGVAALAGRAPHLGVLTLTNHFEDDVERVARAVCKRTGVATLIGCTGEGVIGPLEEVERQPGMALWLAHMPGARIRGCHVHPNDVPAVETAGELRSLVRAADVSEPSFLLLADPFFTPYVIGLLEAFGKVFSGRPVLGGMASGAETPGQSALILNEDVFHEGAVSVVLSGDVEIWPVVSQGCRPVGRPFVITKAQKNEIHQLGGKPALAILNDVFEEATAADRKLMRQGIFIGQVVSEYQEHFERGDFLIRNVIGADQEAESIYVADAARVGTTVQFHVRDATTADADLRSRLDRQPREAVGGLMFSCNGRGTRMFKDPHHDVRAVRDVLGDLPMAGLFCAGEIGPVGNQTFVHGHTASIALFRPRR